MKDSRTIMIEEEEKSRQEREIIAVAKAVRSGRCWLRTRCCCAVLLVLCQVLHSDTSCVVCVAPDRRVCRYYRLEKLLILCLHPRCRGSRGDVSDKPCSRPPRRPSPLAHRCLLVPARSQVQDAIVTPSQHNAPARCNLVLSHLYRWLLKALRGSAVADRP
jgi:hypothetical protein